MNDHEIRLHGRGGQGAVMMSSVLVRCFVSQGKFASGIPFFGVERRGAPVESYVRVSDEPIFLKSRIYNPDCIVILDNTLLKSIDVFNGLTGEGILVINYSGLLQDLNLPDTVKKVGVVDANSIALAALGTPLPNSCMLGAFATTTGWIDLKSVFTGMAEIWAGDLLERNNRAAQLGFDKCHIFERGNL
jgi:2-oxoacid:acceptor oxidoreductase gamma subunit (pyruvate/2-ketoisovalerate family)